jgi:hypothetical protein
MDHLSPIDDGNQDNNHSHSHTNDDDVRTYLNQVGNYRRLTHDEEQHFVWSFFSARNQLTTFLSRLPLIVSARLITARNSEIFELSESSDEEDYSVEESSNSETKKHKIIGMIATIQTIADHLMDISHNRAIKEYEAIRKGCYKSLDKLLKGIQFSASFYQDCLIRIKHIDALIAAGYNNPTE